MALSDTAEYWWDVKKYHAPNMFRHGKGIDCGHNHNVMDTPYIDDLECHACIRIVKEGKASNMLPGKAPETYYMSIREKKLFNKQKRLNELYGKCPCGCIWTVRTNRKTDQQFLGCINYPTCKNTKPLNPQKL